MLQATGEGNEHSVEIKPCTNDNSSFLAVSIERRWHKSIFDIGFSKFNPGTATIEVIILSDLVREILVS